jgi:mannosyltransferase PIG-V
MQDQLSWRTQTATFLARLGWTDLRRVGGAASAVLCVRFVFGALALLISALFPRTPFELQIPLIPGAAPLGLWLQRIFLMPWMHYDSWMYYVIVDHGYTLQENTANFHPLYPLLATLVTPLVGGNIILALLLISTLASVALCVLLVRYVERFYDAALANRAAWLLLLAPPGFILLAPYTESTFLALAVGALFAMRIERWWLAGLLGALATLTRQQGLALAVPLAWGLLVALRARRARLWDAVVLALVPLSYGAFVVYRALVVGDLDDLTQAHGPVDLLHKVLVSHSGIVAGQRITWPWDLLFDQITLIRTSEVNYHLLIDLLLGWLLIGVMLLGLRGMHVLERLYVLALVMLALCYYIGDVDPYMALPRHIMIAFPLYITLAAHIGQRWRFGPIVMGALLINLFLAGLYFFQGWVP